MLLWFAWGFIVTTILIVIANKAVFVHKLSLLTKIQSIGVLFPTLNFVVYGLSGGHNLLFLLPPEDPDDGPNPQMEATHSAKKPKHLVEIDIASYDIADIRVLDVFTQTFCLD